MIVQYQSVRKPQGPQSFAAGSVGWANLDIRLVITPNTLEDPLPIPNDMESGGTQKAEEAYRSPKQVSFKPGWSVVGEEANGMELNADVNKEERGPPIVHQRVWWIGGRREHIWRGQR